ncbi:MAG: hypothetical protein HKP37_10660 [Boseongicola sp.]|nr:pyridoxamine 5'-phosphate oxidase family protein [Boseongicola sp.]NNL19189.1 hypothetical protein [Boseongicola sp.]
MSDALITLNGTRSFVWDELERGVVDKTAPGNLLVIASSSRDHGPTARIVVLRGVDRDSRTLTFFTHSASQKVANFKEDERAKILFWCPEKSLQIRLSVTISMSPVNSRIWEKLGAGTRLNYAVDPTPGTPIEHPAAALQATPKPSAMLQLDARVSEFETLWISPEGLRRAAFDNEQSRWIAP